MKKYLTLIKESIDLKGLLITEIAYNFFWLFIYILTSRSEEILSDWILVNIFTLVYVIGYILIKIKNKTENV